MSSPLAPSFVAPAGLTARRHRPSLTAPATSTGPPRRAPRSRRAHRTWQHPRACAGSPSVEADTPRPAAHSPASDGAAPGGRGGGGGWAAPPTTVNIVGADGPEAGASPSAPSSVGGEAGWAVRQGGRASLGVSSPDEDGGGDDGGASPRLHVVFVHPQIHWNTGNIGRTCLGLGARLHLVGPLGFSLEASQIRRAGLDYWEHVDVRVHDSWDAFAAGELPRLGGTRFFFTKFGAECATQTRWPARGNVVLIFGSEVDGFDGIRDWLDSEHGRRERRVAFPMVDEHFRSFNLSTTASMALWDAYKSLKLAELDVPTS